MKNRPYKLTILAIVAFLPPLTAFCLFYSNRNLANSVSFSYFNEKAAAVLVRRCSATDESDAYVCHGRPFREFPMEIGEEAYRKPKPHHLFPNMLASTCTASCHQDAGKNRFSFVLGASGEIETERQFVLAYQMARRRAHYDGPGKFARILRMPLGSQAGGFGLYHGGGEIFESAADPDYRILAKWVALENETVHHKEIESSEAEVFFKGQVLPVLARNSCMAPSCHIFNHSSFLIDPGMPTEDLTKPIEERFTREQVSFNRMTAKGFIHSLVYLTGDVEQSRMLLKNVPVEKGGILHRGGNDQFFDGPDDPDYLTVKKWLSLERQEAMQSLKIGGEPVREGLVGKLRGVVFVRTTRENHRKYLDVGRYLPGGDLFLLKLKEGETLDNAQEAPINLTGRFHPGSTADVREPDVRYDGRAILFAMRVGEADSLNIYEISLDENLDVVEGSFRRLTYGPRTVNGIRVHFTDPTYVPDPADENAANGGYNLDRADVCFASNLAGEVVQSVERGIVGEADGGTFNTIIDFDRPEMDGSFVGRHLYIVDGTNKGSWRTITAFRNRLFSEEKRSTIKVDRAFAEPVDDSTIYVIERDPDTQPGFLPSYSVYGLKYPLEGKEQFMYQETLTRLTWSPGQELDLSVRTTGELFFVSQRSSCDKFGRPIFHMTSCRRHLDTRFSFPTHHGNRSQVLVYADNHELPSGIDIHVGLDPDNLWEGGNLSVSDHQFGPGLEARNPHDYATGIFDEDGVPKTASSVPSARQLKSTGKQLSHTRVVFKKIPLFPLRGPEAVSRTGFSPGGTFRDPIPLPDGRILVSHAPGPINHFDPEARPDFDLYIIEGDPSFHPPGGKGIPKIRKTKLNGASAVGVSELQPYPIYVRFKQKINAAKRPKEEHLIRYPGMAPDLRPAKYLERNYLLIDAIMHDPTPVGKRVAYPRDPVTGELTKAIDKVAFVRFVEALPMTPQLAAPVDTAKIRNGDSESTLVSNGIHPLKRMVGEAPVYDDGSVFVHLPSNTPFIIQSLNGDRMALRQEARYYFFAPNETFTISPSRTETFQTCGACHGALSGNPSELFGPINPFAGQGSVKAITKNSESPLKLGLSVEDRLAIDFRRDIQPLLDEHCTACHQKGHAAAGLQLTGEKTRYYSNSYENLMQLEDPSSGWYGRKRYVSERDALAIESYLIEKIYGRELKAPRELSGDFPHPSPALFREFGMDPAPLNDKQRLVLVRWIDLGATFRWPEKTQVVSHLNDK